jgi:putative ABC transport system ATP-binding protein
VLKLIGVTKWFPRGSVEKVVALNDIDFKVNPSDFITIIGSNGAGKSTLLNLIAGVHFSDSGKIIFENKDITRLAEYRRSMYMGRVYQDPMMGTASMMSVEENMAVS